MFNLKKISITVIGTTILLGTTVFAETGTVTTDGLRMRKEASTDSEIVTSLNKNATVEIIEKAGDWYKVKYYDEYEGYLYAEYVKTDSNNSITVETDTTENAEETNKQPEKVVENKVPETNIESNIQYPIETSTKIETKLYKLPLITSTSINEIPKDTKLQAEKELNNWVYVSSETISGWVRKSTLNIENSVEIPKEEAKQEESKQENNKTEEPKQEEKQVETTEEKTASISKGYIKVEAARIRKEASTSSEILEVLTLNTDVKILEEIGEWYKIQFNNITGYVSKSLISENALQTSRSSVSRTQTQDTKSIETIDSVQEEKTADIVNEEDKTVESTENETTKEEITVIEAEEIKQEEKQLEATEEKNVEKEEVKPETTREGQKIADFAKQYAGKAKYVYGGTSPNTGFDCSGFVYYVYNACGHAISRSCSVQAKSGRAISKANLEAGDLVFFDNTSDGSIGHVGIYIGDGNFVHAATSKKGVRIDTINSGYYNTYYYSARRILN